MCHLDLETVLIKIKFNMCACVHLCVRVRVAGEV